MPWSVAVRGMTTVRSGSALSLTVTACVPPSGTVYASAPNDTVTCGSSSSVMVTTVSAVAPSDTPSGRFVAKASSTLSPSSSSASAVAVKVIVCDVSPSLNVTLNGTE